MVSMKKRKLSDEPNLKRFKLSVSELITENEDSTEVVPKEQPKPIDHDTIKLTRKELRKEKRNLTKMRNLAFQQKKKLPTAEGLAEERLTVAKKEAKRRKLKAKKRLQKERKAERLKEEEEEAEMERIINEKEKVADDKIIKDMEKKLKMNKRKNKSTLPESFCKDGLDYILNVIESGTTNPDLYESSEDEAIHNEELADEEYAAEESADEESADEEMADEEMADEEMADEEVADEESADEEVADEESADEEATDTDSANAVLEKITESKSINKKGILLKEGEDKKEAVKISEKHVTFKAEKSRSHKNDKSQHDAGSQSINDDDISKGDLSNDEDDMISDDEEGEDENENDIPDSEEDSEDEDSEDSHDDDPKNTNNLAEKNVEGDANDESQSDHDNDVDNEDADFDENSAEEKLKEDIYGRLKDAEGNVMKSQAYVPPGKRLALLEKKNHNMKDIQKISKLLKGLLNRLSESNLQGISKQIEDLYRTYSRAALTDTLCSLIIDSLLSPSNVPDRIIMEQGLLISVLHYNIGCEIGATFLQEWAKKLDLFYNSEDYGEGKQMTNFVTMLTHLYNFKVVQSLLLFDILKKFIEKFAEKDIELLLLILKNVGFSLRKDDPFNLKEIIISIQSKASSIDNEVIDDQSRVKFMLDILMAIKNNNMRKIPNYDPSHIEHLQKMLKSIQKGGSSAEMQLRISYEDLMTAEEKGRWWLVGSAWSGINSQLSEDCGSFSKIDTSEFSQDILDLARKQRMNTDIRRTIFCIILSSEDFVDAFEKLLHLNLRNQQEREIICVIVDIVMQMKTYNPFYALLAHKFCEYHRRFQMTFQCNLWDKFKIKDFSKLALSHLSQFISNLIARKSISISIFKVIEFSDIDKNKVFLIKSVLKSLLLEYEEDNVKETFGRIAGSPKLNTLREGLKIFMNVFIVRDKKLQPDLKQTLIRRIEIADKALRSGEPDFNF